MSARFSSRVLRTFVLPRIPRQCPASYIRNHFSVPQRSYSTTRKTSAALAGRTIAQHSVVVFSPSPAQIEQQNIEVDFIPPEEVKIDITDRAAEVRPFSLSSVVEANKLAATPSNLLARKQSRRCSQNISRIRRMSWVSVQNGTSEV
jgi:hypothetical protein